eukprot:TRINITY_DN109_c0_g1_i12.p1 TRINITY_DN109_c0_g1~~TRINITY_DN109_c0_g1_i12.p1  ORF type:complete len:206 (+),score=10.25 TRINITY_DN109_c0_g1_i12:1-618(+)
MSSPQRVISIFGPEHLNEASTEARRASAKNVRLLMDHFISRKLMMYLEYKDEDRTVSFRSQTPTCWLRTYHPHNRWERVSQGREGWDERMYFCSAAETAASTPAFDGVKKFKVSRVCRLSNACFWSPLNDIFYQGLLSTEIHVYARVEVKFEKEGGGEVTWYPGVLEYSRDCQNNSVSFDNGDSGLVLSVNELAADLRHNEIQFI